MYKLILYYRKVIFKLIYYSRALGSLVLKNKNKIQTIDNQKSYALEDKELTITNQDAADWIKKRLNSGLPTMIGRLGSVELGNILEYEYQFYTKRELSFMDKLYQFVYNNKTFRYNWTQKQDLKYNAGFFPITPQALAEFHDLMVESMRELDLLGSWVKGENVVRGYFPDAEICRLGDLEPYFQPDPWSEALEGKKVLVIHPFADSIQHQYEKNRTKLFKNPKVLPQFELKTIKAVQSLGGESDQFSTWFEALSYMQDQIKETDFDCAIIGCGAYGFPLAAFVKKLGKQAIHLGGATQVLFGIRGKRWDKDPRYDQFINEYWKRPDKSETPKTASIVEEGCYW